MENEKNGISWETVEIGKDEPQLKPQRVKIMEYTVSVIKDKNDKVIGEKLNLLCKYPDKNEAIEISGVKYQDKDKLKCSGLWLKLDSDSKIPYKSAISNMLRFYRLSSIKSLIGMELDTIADDNGYLLIKAY